MKAEIISIGDELLIGQVINTNASWITEELYKAGIATRQITAISDDKSEIIRSLSEAGSKADLIMTTGGLGPTGDDNTREALCDFFNTGLKEDPAVMEDIKLFFKKRGLNVTETNRQQAFVPENCKVIPNKFGTAPGFWFEKNGKIFISMPGVPYELKKMVTGHVIPLLKDRYFSNAIIHKTILTHGIGESYLADKIKGWENELPPGLKLAYLPSPGIVRLRLTMTGADSQQLTGHINESVKKLRDIIPQYIFGEDQDTLQGVVSELLKKRNKSLSIAESCTGGKISHLITSIPGASQYFTGGVIAYDNDIKINHLNVDKSLIERYGAVSKQVAESMAAGIKRIMQTDYALATTGIAGPEGGTPGKPAGMVWIALAYGDKITSKKYLFGDNRERNITRTSLAALNMLRLAVVSQ